MGENPINKKMIFSLLLSSSIIWALSVNAQDSGVQSILDSYVSALGPPRFLCGSGPRPLNANTQASQLEIDTLAKIRKHGNAAIPVLIQNLSKTGGDHRILGICEQALGALGPAAVPALVSMLQNGQSDIPHRCILSASNLIKYTDTTTRQKALVALLNTSGHSQPACWSAAADITRLRGNRNLNDSGDYEGDLLARYAMHFAAGLNSANVDVRRASAEMLKHCAPKLQNPELSSRVASSLAKYLDSRINQRQKEFDISVVEAISFLPYAPPIAAIKTLSSCAGSTDKFVAESSVSSLIFLASRFPEVPLDGVLNLLSGSETEKSLVVNRLRLLTRRRSEVVPYLIRLGKSQSKQDSKVLIQLCLTLGNYRKDALPAVPLLIDFLANSDIQVQKEACGALFHLGPDAKQALPSLYKLCKSTKDNTVYSKAIRAIKSLSR